jgi:hypothetical protein
LNLIDFNKSYLYWLTKSNSNARFNIESAFNIDNEQFVLCSGVYGCSVYSDKDLFLKPSLFFQTIFSLTHHKVLRTYTTTKNADSTHLNEERFINIEMVVKNSEDYALINSFNEIKAAFNSGKEIISKILIRKPIIAELIFPVKHINLDFEKERFQVETGPVLIYTDLTKNSLKIEKLLPAYIAFTSLKKFEFIPFEERKTRGNDYNRSFYEPKVVEAEILLYCK